MGRQRQRYKQGRGRGMEGKEEDKPVSVIHCKTLNQFKEDIRYIFTHSVLNISRRRWICKWILHSSSRAVEKRAENVDLFSSLAPASRCKRSTTVVGMAHGFDEWFSVRFHPLTSATTTTTTTLEPFSNLLNVVLTIDNLHRHQKEGTQAAQADQSQFSTWSVPFLDILVNPGQTATGSPDLFILVFHNTLLTTCVSPVLLLVPWQVKMSAVIKAY